MTQASLFDWRTSSEGCVKASELRDQGAIKVLDRAGDEWRAGAMRLIRQRFRGCEVTGEDFRLICEAAGLFPHHPNAWGALTLSMKRAGLLKETGQWRNGRDPKSHARAIRVYTVL
jgi:hypothetical protein